jgi:anti-sigma factor RsiW
MNHTTQEALIDYLHGELAPEEDAAVLVHLEGCDACRSEYEVQARLSEALHAYAEMTDVELPGHVRAAIWNQIETEQRTSWRARMVAWMRPVAGVAVAAAAAVAIVIGVSPRHAGPAIDAMYYLEDHAALTASVPFHEGSAVPSSLVTGVVMNDQQWLASSGSGDIAVDALTH